MCGLLVQTVVLRYMLAWLGEARVLTVGLSAAMLEMLLVSFISAKWQVQWYPMLHTRPPSVPPA